MWCSYHKTTIHNGADCRATPANGLHSNAHFAQVPPPSVLGICSSWDLPVRDDSNEKPCISFLARKVQPAAKPAKARGEEEKGTGHSAQSRQQRPRGGELAPGHFLRMLSSSLQPSPPKPE